MFMIYMNYTLIKLKKKPIKNLLSKVIINYSNSNRLITVNIKSFR